MSAAPANWGLGVYTDQDLADALASVEGHLASGGGDRERLEARRSAILAEQDERALIAESGRAHP